LFQEKKGRSRPEEKVAHVSLARQCFRTRSCVSQPSSHVGGTPILWPSSHFFPGQQSFLTRRFVASSPATPTTSPQTFSSIDMSPAPMAQTTVNRTPRTPKAKHAKSKPLVPQRKLSTPSSPETVTRGCTLRASLNPQYDTADSVKADLRTSLNNFVFEHVFRLNRQMYVSLSLFHARH
jgi:hypothetical protein